MNRRNHRFLAEALERRVLLSFGELEPNFATNGLATATFGSFPLFPPASASAIVVQPNNFIVAVGSVGAVGGLDMAVVRFRPDGSIDTTFGTSGRVTIDTIGGGGDRAFAVTLDSQRRIIVAGSVTGAIAPGFERFAVARLLENGTLDTSFGSGGSVVVGFPGDQARATGVAITSNGRILVTGSTRIGSGADFAAIRLLENGTLDTTFASSGRGVYNLGSEDISTSMVLQPNGRAVLAGYTKATALETDEFAAIRITAGGALDSSFGVGGVRIIEAVPGASQATGVGLASDGKIYLGGMSNTTTFPKVAVVRLTTAGSVDSTFGNNGVGGISPLGNNFIQSLVVQQDDKPVLSGWRDVGAPTTEDFIAVRFNTDGAVDFSFATTGFNLRDFGAHERAFGMAIDEDGSILLAGSQGNSLAVMRYRGAMDIRFGLGGQVVRTIVTAASSVDLASAVIRDPDGKLVIIGTSDPELERPRMQIRRYHPNGLLDFVGTHSSGFSDIHGTALARQSTGRYIAVGFAEINDVSGTRVVRFNSNGTTDGTFISPGPLSGSNDSATAVAIQPDDRIVVAGIIGPLAGGSQLLYLMRLGPNGGLDLSFGNLGSTVIPYSGHTGSVDVALQPDGKIVTLTTAAPAAGETPRPVVTRFNANGSVDQSFGSNGSTYVQNLASPAAGVATGQAVLIDAQGRIVVAGTSQLSLVPRFYAARLLPNGSSDVSFGTSGRTQIDLGGNSFLRDVTLAPDGKIILAGSTTFHPTSGQVLNNSNFAVVRLDADGQPDTTLSSVQPKARGEINLDVAGSTDVLSAVVVLPDGDIVGAGQSHGSYALVRLNGAPAASAYTAQFRFDDLQQNIAVQFTDNVSASLSASSFTLQNMTTGQMIDPSAMSLDYVEQDNLLKIAFPGFEHGALPDGHYRFRLPAGAVHDTAGNTNRLFEFSFFFLQADANRDGVVNLADFNILAQNFGQTGRTFSQGNFDYDPEGRVNLNDFNILASRFGISLAAATNGAATSGAPFGTTRISASFPSAAAAPRLNALLKQQEDPDARTDDGIVPA